MENDDKNINENNEILDDEEEEKLQVGEISSSQEYNHGKIDSVMLSGKLKRSFLNYAMSVIVDRALPDARDGLKPVQRRILYGMDELKVYYNVAHKKSARIVGDVMGKYHPHGDSSIYEALVRMAQDFSYRYPLVDGHGNFGSIDGDGAAAMRYTEARMSKISAEMLRDLRKNTVDFVPNYDATELEPAVLPARIPNLLVNGATGIAVGMASNICSFNLREICETTAALIRDPDHDIKSTLPAPDFTGGCQIIYDENVINQVYETGRGSIKLRAKYVYDKSANCIDILSIPATTTCEVIIEKVIDLVKQGKVKEISDIRDETGIDGLKITIDLKRGIDADKLMTKLYRFTTLEDSYACNFNVLIAGVPRVLGVKALLEEWIAFRIECVRRRTYFDRNKKADKLHLLRGLEKILLDIDKAVKIVRETDEESEVVPNLMIGFGIDEIQAEYVAEIKLRHLNREYILKRTKDLEDLEKEIAELDEILKSKARIKTIIVKELKSIAEKYGQPRKSIIIYDDVARYEEETVEIPDYPVNLFFTKEGYFKKITPQSLRMSGEQKLKDGDEIIQELEFTNNCDLLFFTDKCQVYKAKADDFAQTKASVLGDYVAAKLGFDEGENAVKMVVTKDYKGMLLFAFENGKAAKVPLESYATKTNRKKLTGAYSDKSPLVGLLYMPEDEEVLFKASSGNMLLVHTGALALKTTRSTQGVAVLKPKKGHRLFSIERYKDGTFTNPRRYRTSSLPARGALPVNDDSKDEQLSLI